MTLSYIPLHVHTTYSPDGLGTVEALIDFAAKNFSAMAITDHGTLAGIAEFWTMAKQAGIRPIYGNEIYMSHNGKRGHLTVLSNGEEGFKSLVALNNAAHENLDSKHFPIVTIELLEKYNKGLTVLSGCSASPLYQGSEADAMHFAASLYDIFGAERFFAEVMGVYHEDNVTRPLTMAKRFGLMPVVTTDSHFVRPNQSGAHKIMTQCRKGYDYFSDDLYLKTPEELLRTSWFHGVLDSSFLEELMENTNKVAERLESFDLSSPPTLPKADVIEVDGRQVNIIDAAIASFEVYTMDPSVDIAVAKERLEREIKVVKELGLVDYFSILFDIVQFCKRSSIKVGPGRGSGGGSFFLFLLGITEVDPIVHGLLFERFLSASRKDMADFDLDVDANRRDEVLKYAKERWGALPIANFSTYSNASLIRDLARIYRVPMEITEKAADLADTDPDVLEEFFAYCRDTSTGTGVMVTSKDAVVAYDSMLHQVRHTGKHAGGVVICTRPVPIEGGKVVWVEGVKSRVLSAVGLVKYDILGVTALAQLQEMEDLTGVAPGEPWHSDAPEVFKNIFQTGKTTGVFQFSGSQGIVELTKKVKPETLADLAAINALYRPGPLDSGMAWEYPDSKLSPRKLHPDVDLILKDTYGIIVFQEQVMALVAKITGGNLEEADDARKIISKGKVGDPVWQGKMRKLEDHFKTEGEKAYPKKLIDLLWSEIVTFGRYGFNKSHSVAYSLLAYRMAWYKNYYPGAFYTALLNSDQENAEKWVYDAALHGISVVPPHINRSEVKWLWDKENTIYAPLSVVKYFGEKGAAEVVAFRSRLENGFENIGQVSQIPKRILNKRAKRLLFYAAAFRGMEGSVSEILDDYENLPILSEADAQVESFGFVLPTDKIIEFLNREHASHRVAGFVKEIEERDKGRGKYKVYRLVPFGSFWTKDQKLMNGIKVGHCVSAKVSPFGSGEDVRRLKL
jgi:DNA polymerase-3 subunit alpha